MAIKRILQILMVEILKQALLLLSKLNLEPLLPITLKQIQLQVINYVQTQAGQNF